MQPNPKLLAALAITDGLVKVIGHRAFSIYLEVNQVVALVERYPHDWNFKLRGTGTVKWICAIRTPDRKWEHCYRTAEAPVLPPSIEWLRSREGR